MHTIADHFFLTPIPAHLLEKVISIVKVIHIFLSTSLCTLTLYVCGHQNISSILTIYIHIYILNKCIVFIYIVKFIFYFF